MTFRLGLTGSIGMGKTTTAAMFAEAGVPVWSADDCVHRLYAPGGAGVPAIAALCPAAVLDGAVSRPLLRAAIAADPALLPRIEAAIHPLVAADRAAFLAAASADIVVLDIPLLFETGADAACDAVAVVSTTPAEQAARVLSRPGMTRADLDLILSRQMPDSRKRALADYVIPTRTLDGARAAVHDVIADIRRRIADARDRA
jgi:dephospho-CoA kinase